LEGLLGGGEGHGPGGHLLEGPGRRLGRQQQRFGHGVGLEAAPGDTWLDGSARLEARDPEHWEIPCTHRKRCGTPVVSRGK